MEQQRFDFYANNVNVVSGFYDITLQFSTQAPVGPITPGGQPAIETTGLCNIRMSPQHAKALAAILVRHIVQYEDQLKVKLPLPPEIEEMWNSRAIGIVK